MHYNVLFDIIVYYSREARWLHGQCAWRVIAEAKQRSQWSVIGWVTKIYYLELLRALDGKLLVPAAFAVVSIHSSFEES
jgi:hypothetical protein